MYEHSLRVGALTLLDLLSTAFDTVDHSVLTNVMRKRFDVSGKALGWVEEYMHGRSQAVRVNCNESASTVLKFGVPQGSVLGPKIFINYAKDVRRSSAIMTSVTICSPMTCNVYAVASQLKFLLWSRILKTVTGVQQNNSS